MLNCSSEARKQTRIRRRNYHFLHTKFIEATQSLLCLMNANMVLMMDAFVNNDYDDDSNSFWLDFLFI